MSGTKLERLRVDADVWTLALERVHHAYQLYENVAVSFSGGKDSTATLHAVLEVATELGRLPVRTIFFDEEVIPTETVEYMRRVGERDDVDLEWYCLPFQHRNACSQSEPFWWPWAPEARDVWARELPPEAITEHPAFPVDPPNVRMSEPVFAPLLFPPETGTWAMAMGIRAAESLTRLEALLRTDTEPYLVTIHGDTASGNVAKLYPVYDWTTEDVWSAPATFGWDYNRAYDLMEMAGVGHSAQRCSPAYGEEPLEKLWTYAQCFPDIWEKGCARVPGAAAAGRYARTELYGYRDRPTPPDGWTWQDLVGHYIAQHAEEVRPLVAYRVRSWIAQHYKETTDPILGEMAHPETGVSWQKLVMLAMRGDFKQRKRRRPMAMDPESVAPRRVRYDAERERQGL